MTKLPPRNWRRYWWAYLLHGLSGGLAAIGILKGGVWRTFALVGLAVELFYQLVEFMRRGDLRPATWPPSRSGSTAWCVRSSLSAGGPEGTGQRGEQNARRV